MAVKQKEDVDLDHDDFEFGTAKYYRFKDDETAQVPAPAAAVDLGKIDFTQCPKGVKPGELGDYSRLAFFNSKANRAHEKIRRRSQQLKEEEPAKAKTTPVVKKPFDRQLRSYAAPTGTTPRKPLTVTSTPKFRRSTSQCRDSSGKPVSASTVSTPARTSTPSAPATSKDRAIPLRRSSSLVKQAPTSTPVRRTPQPLQPAAAPARRVSQPLQPLPSKIQNLVERLSSPKQNKVVPPRTGPLTRSNSINSQENRVPILSTRLRRR